MDECPCTYQAEEGALNDLRVLNWVTNPPAPLPIKSIILTLKQQLPTYLGTFLTSAMTFAKTTILLLAVLFVASAHGGLIVEDDDNPGQIVWNNDVWDQ